MAKTVIQQRTQNLLNKSSNQDNLDEFGVKRKRAFLDLLLELRDTENSLSDEELINEVNTFLFAVK